MGERAGRFFLFFLLTATPYSQLTPTPPRVSVAGSDIRRNSFLSSFRHNTHTYTLALSTIQWTLPKGGEEQTLFFWGVHRRTLRTSIGSGLLCHHHSKGRRVDRTLSSFCSLFEAKCGPLPLPLRHSGFILGHRDKQQQGGEGKSERGGRQDHVFIFFISHSGFCQQPTLFRFGFVSIVPLRGHTYSILGESALRATVLLRTRSLIINPNYFFFYLFDDNRVPSTLVPSSLLGWSCPSIHSHVGLHWRHARFNPLVVQKPSCPSSLH